jgi:hypothetical protein
MTLARTALRLCVSACLKGDVDARPTIAEGMVYDSRISELAPESLADDAKAIIILLTDGDEGEALSAQNGGPPFHRMIDLVVEMNMTAAILEPGAEGDPPQYVVGYPETDAQLEGSLDLLEFQVLRRLQYDLSPLPVLFRSFVRIRKHDSHRQVLDQSGVKLACRILVLTCEVNDDQVLIYNPASTAPVLPTGFDVLPEPLRRVAKALPAGSSGLEVCTSLAASLTPVEAPPLRIFDINVTNPNAAPPVEAPVNLPQDTED